MQILKYIGLDAEIAVGKLIITIEYGYPAFHLLKKRCWCKNEFKE